MSEIQATVDYTLSKGASFRNIIVAIPTDSGETFYPQVSRNGSVITFSVPDLSVNNNWSKLYNFNIIVQDTFGSATYTYDTSSNYVPYSPIYEVSQAYNFKLSRPNVLSDKVNLSFAFEYWHGYYATNVQNNATIKWRVREVGGTWSNWQTLVENIDYKSIDRGVIPDYWVDRTIVGTFDNNDNFTSTEISNPLDTVWSYLKNYEFEINIEDSLNSTTQSAIMHSSVSIYDAFQTSNGDRYLNVNGKLIFNNDYENEVGATLASASTNASTALSQSNTNASNITALQNVMMTNISKQQNGYVKFANGFIVQWGYNKAGTAFDLPISFTSTTSFSIVGNDTTQGASGVINFVVNSKKNVTIYCHVPNGAYYQDYVRWIAIGY